MRLGKRPGTGLRIELSSRHEVSASSPAVQSPKRLRNSSPGSPGDLTPVGSPGGPVQPPFASPPSTGLSAEPTSVPTSVPVPPSVPVPRPNAVPARARSSFSRSGCLSPTDSAPLLQRSLALARGKALSESEDLPPPNAAELAKAPEHKDRIGHYVLLSKLDSEGRCFHALDTRTQKLAACQVLSGAQLAHLLKVRQRLNAAVDAPADAVAAVLPSATEVLTHGNRHFLFSPQTFGSLHSYVQSRKKLGEDVAKALFGQIVRMVELCHSVGIVVRDLKLRQFVFADAEQTRLRMGWVGDVVVLAKAGEDALSDRHGCPAYVSPEILDLGQPSHSGYAADLWSLGVLLFLILLGRYPFYDHTPARLFSKIRAGQFWIPSEEGLSLEARLLIRGLLRRDPKARPSAALLASVPWLRSATTHSTRPNPTPNNAKASDDANDHVVPSL